MTKILEKLGLSESIEQIVHIISSRHGRAYVVGGAVRDALLGIQPKDIDIEVHDVSPETVLLLLKRFGKCAEVGQAFGVIKLTMQDGETIDISFPRVERKTGTGHTGFDVQIDPYIGTKAAASRRDLTINSIMVDAISGAIIDHFGGIQDLYAGILRHTSEAFSEDPLRVLRVAQFAARFNMNVAPETVELCRSMLPEFETISKERIWGEFEKIFTKGVNISKARWFLMECGWAKHFPFCAHTTIDFSSIIENKVQKVVAWIIAESKSDQVLAQVHFPISQRNKVLEMAESIRFFWVQPTNTFIIRQFARSLKHSTLDDVWDVARLSLPPMKAPEAFEEVRHGPLPIFITGEDLIQAGFAPGPEFKTILAITAYRVDEGLITSREQSLAQLAEMFDKKVRLAP